MCGRESLLTDGLIQKFAKGNNDSTTVGLEYSKDEAISKIKVWYIGTDLSIGLDTDDIDVDLIYSREEGLSTVSIILNNLNKQIKALNITLQSEDPYLLISEIKTFKHGKLLF